MATELYIGGLFMEVYSCNKPRMGLLIHPVDHRMVLSNLVIIKLFYHFQQEYEKNLETSIF